MFKIQIENESVQPGDAIVGEASWMSDREGKINGLVLTYGWRTEGRGDKNSHEFDKVTIHPATNVFKGQTVRGKFRLPIPEFGPESYNGQLLRIIWECKVTADIPWAFDKHETHQFQVGQVDVVSAAA